MKRYGGPSKYITKWNKPSEMSILYDANSIAF